MHLYPKVKPRNNDPIEWLTFNREAKPEPTPPAGYAFFADNDQRPLVTNGQYLTVRKETNDA